MAGYEVPANQSYVDDSECQQCVVVNIQSFSKVQTPI